VNAILLLMGLLVLSYIGSFLVTRRSVGSAGLPSGIEYTALGYLLGPHALGLIGPDDLKAFEPDELANDEYHPMDPAGSSPLVAWLASDEAQHVTGQVIRAIHDKIYLMQGWREAATISSDQRRWDATTLGTQIATDLFGTRAPGLR